MKTHIPILSYMQRLLGVVPLVSKQWLPSYSPSLRPPDQQRIIDAFRPLLLTIRGASSKLSNSPPQIQISEALHAISPDTNPNKSSRTKKHTDQVPHPVTNKVKPTRLEPTIASITIRSELQRNAEGIEEFINLDPPPKQRPRTTALRDRLYITRLGIGSTQASHFFAVTQAGTTSSSYNRFRGMLNASSNTQDNTRTSTHRLSIRLADKKIHPSILPSK